MLSFPCNSAELCPEQHFLTPNFLSFMLLLSRFTKSFKNKLLKAFTKKGRLASVKNCHPLKFCGIVFIPFLQKKFNIHKLVTFFCLFSFVACRGHFFRLNPLRKVRKISSHSMFSSQAIILDFFTETSVCVMRVGRSHNRKRAPFLVLGLSA